LYLIYIQDSFQETIFLLALWCSLEYLLNALTQSFAAILEPLSGGKIVRQQRFVSYHFRSRAEGANQRLKARPQQH